MFENFSTKNTLSCSMKSERIYWSNRLKSYVVIKLVYLAVVNICDQKDVDVLVFQMILKAVRQPILDTLIVVFHMIIGLRAMSGRENAR